MIEDHTKDEADVKGEAEAEGRVAEVMPAVVTASSKYRLWGRTSHLPCVPSVGQFILDAAAMAPWCASGVARLATCFAIVLNAQVVVNPRTDSSALVVEFTAWMRLKLKQE